jgi:hypothetical protein
MGGQLGISIPDKKMLIVTTADTQGMQGGNQIIYDCINEHLIPYVKDQEIGVISDEHKSAYDEMMDVAKELSIAPPRLPKSRRDEKIVSFINKKQQAESPIEKEGFRSFKYTLDENRHGFETMRLNFSDEGVSSLRLTRKSSNIGDSQEENLQKIDLSFGIGKMCEGIFPVYNVPYIAGAIWLRENVLFIKVHLIGECVGSVRFELYFEDSEVTVFMHKIEETYFNEFEGHLHGTLVKS